MESYYPLKPEQIWALERQGCTCEAADWSRVQVSADFTTDRIRHVEFRGEVRIGRLDGVCSAAPDAEPGLYHATLTDCRIGNQVRIARMGVHLARYEIGDGACLEDVGLMETTSDATFGSGVEIDAVNEGGGRGVIPFPELSSQTAHLMCLHRHRPVFQQRLAKMVQAVATPAHGPRGTVGEAALVRSVPEIVNVSIGSAAMIQGATSLVDGRVLSHPEARTTIGAGVQAESFIVAEGSQITSGAMLRRTFVGQGCRIGRQFSAENCLFFANCEGFHGEACSVFAGPYTVTHHKSTLLIAGIFSFYNAGSGTNQSNHMYKLGPNHEGKLERGSKTGSFSYMMWPCRVGPFSLVLGKHSRTFDTADFPFSSLDATPDGRCEMIPGLLLTTVGTLRDGNKWPKRDRRSPAVPKRDRISFDVLSPLTVGRMVRGTATLKQLQDSTDKSVSTVTIHGAEIKRVLLRTGQKYYRRGIQLYLTDKIIARVDAGLQQGDATLGEALAVSADAVFSEQWIDVGGQLMPRQRLLDLYELVETGHIANIEALEAQLTKIQEAYSQDEWLWVTKIFQQTAGVDLNQAKTDDIRSIADTYLKTRKEFLQLILLDASKEYHELSQVGFGVDPEAQSADFHAVRGEFTANEFATDLQQEIDQLEPFVEDLKSRLGVWT